MTKNENDKSKTIHVMIGISDMDNAYSYIAISVNFCSDACKGIKNKDGVIVLELFSLKGSNEMIAFILEPDGYQIELIQR